MTRKQALAELIEKVEAGGASPYFTWQRSLELHYSLGYRAAGGSLDAAKALREAVLTPDYIMSSDSTGYAHLYRDEYECTHTWDALLPGQQARAELLAILRALHSMEPSE